MRQTCEVVFEWKVKERSNKAQSATMNNNMNFHLSLLIIQDNEFWEEYQYDDNMKSYIWLLTTHEMMTFGHSHWS